MISCELKTLHARINFSSEEALQAHMNSKRHKKCNVCSKRFLNENSLQQHIKNKHERDNVLAQEKRLKYPRCKLILYMFISKHLLLRKSTGKSKAPKFNWSWPKFCCEKENCGKLFMSTEQLAHHHKVIWSLIDATILPLSVVLCVNQTECETHQMHSGWMWTQVPQEIWHVSTLQSQAWHG